MEIWNYNPYNGEFICKSLADESPLEPGEFLIPAYATTIPAPEPQEGKAIVFVNNKWDFEEDHRGETWWDEEGNPIIIQEIGKPLDTLSSVEPPPKPIKNNNTLKDLTPAEKLAMIGLSTDDLKTLLGIE